MAYLTIPLNRFCPCSNEKLPLSRLFADRPETG